MLTPEQINTLEILGYVYFRLGRLDEARIVFEGLLALAPDSRHPRKHLAAIALAEKDSREALQQLSAYLGGQAPDECDTPVLLMQAQAYWLAGRRDESGAAVQEYLRRNRKEG